jgi:hypothetical protein
MEFAMSSLQSRKAELAASAAINPEQVAAFTLKYPVATFGDSSDNGTRVQDAYEAVVQGLSSGKVDAAVKAALRELQYQANVNGNKEAAIILTALDDYGLAPPGVYDRLTHQQLTKRQIVPEFPEPKPRPKLKEEPEPS